MFRFIILLSLFAICFAKRQAEDRIVGGDDININEVPFQVSVQEMKQHFCGGTLVDSTTVVTAAHCINHKEFADLSVRGKSSNWNSGGEISKVVKIIPHDEYDGTTMDNDIAILKLEKPITTSFAKLPGPNYDPALNFPCFVSGWGLLKEGSKTAPTVLQGVHLNIVERYTCNKNYDGVLTKNMICAASPGKDSCQMDSGGPLVMEGFLVGVVSWGYACADPDHPGVYARVGNYVDWIKSNMN